METQSIYRKGTETTDKKRVSCGLCQHETQSLRLKLPKGMPMKGLRRNDDAMKNKCL